MLKDLIGEEILGNIVSQRGWHVLNIFRDEGESEQTLN
jgi:hypothetical protein